MDNLTALLTGLVAELNALNSHEQLGGYLNVLAEDFNADLAAASLPLLEVVE